MLQALITREDAERIARWEVFPHVYIVESSTERETSVGTEPCLDGIQFADDNAIRGNLFDGRRQHAILMGHISTLKTEF